VRSLDTLLAVSIALDTHPGGNAMSEHVFHDALAFGHLSDLAAGGRRHALVGAGLEELAHPQPTGVARRAACGQDVVGANAFVAVGDGGLFADEKRAIVGQVREKVIGVLTWSSRCSGA